jgi:desulfoferrodoxin-like iron-binding protein
MKAGDGDPQGKNNGEPRKEIGMNVKKVGEKYRCNLCGNEVEVTKAGGGELVCCGEPMEKTAG